MPPVSPAGVAEPRTARRLEDGVSPQVRGIRWLSTGIGSGLGDASAAYLAGLREAGVPVSWSPLGWPSTHWDAPYGPRSDVPELAREDAVLSSIVNSEIEHDTVVVCSTPLWHEQLRVEAAGRRLVSYTTWESDRLPGASVDVLNHYDAVLVPSFFNADVFKSSGVSVPVEVVPHCAPASRRSSAPEHEGGFIFYMISTWTTRKAVLEAISAYLLAFTAEDDVALVIHTTPEDQIARERVARGKQALEPHSTASWYTLAKALAGRTALPKIVLSTRQLAPAEIAKLHEEGSCFFSLSHGEGWGLGSFEAAAFGNPAIVVGWGGPLDYLPAGYPYLVSYRLEPTLSEEPDAWWEPHQGERWAKADPEAAAALLRHVFEHREEAHGWGAVLQENIYAKFSRPAVTERLLGVLGALRLRP